MEPQILGQHQVIKQLHIGQVLDMEQPNQVHYKELNKAPQEHQNMEAQHIQHIEEQETIDIIINIY